MARFIAVDVAPARSPIWPRRSLWANHVRGLGTHQRDELFDLLARGVQPRVDGPDRHAQELGNLRTRYCLDLVHHEHRTLSQNELAEHRLGQLSPLAEDEELVDGNYGSRFVPAAESRWELVRVLPPSPI